jgi:hypothetical protein
MNRIALIAGAVTGLVLALAAGAVLGRRAVPNPVATQVVHLGSARVIVPRAWHPVRSTRSAAILETAPGQRAVVRLGPVRTPAASARATMLAGYRAWREGTVTVLATSSGLLTVDCPTCTDAIQQIVVRDVAILDPTPDLALALRAPDVVAELDRARVRGRHALRRATTPADQGRLARRLAAAHAGAAAALRPVAGPDLLERFADVGSAYSDLATATTTGSAQAFDAARARIATAETKLTRSLGDIAPPRVQPPAAAPAPVANHVVPRPLLVLVITVFAGLGAGLALLRGRRRAEPALEGRAPATALWLAGLRTAVSERPPPERSQWLARPVSASPQPVANGWASAPSAARPATPSPVAERPAAERPAAKRPAAKRPARREVPVPPGTKWTCELAWSANLRHAGFRVQATGPGETTVEVARSRNISWPPLMAPPPQPDLVAAARSVAKALVEAGWTPTSKGSDWYAQRFAWARDGSPPPLGTV